MKYLVTGATGAFGARAIETLSKKVGVGDIAASVRDKSKAKKLIDMGIDVRQADFNDPRSLDEAFSGIDRVLMVSTNEPIDEKRIKQHTNAINAAKKNGAKLWYIPAEPIIPSDRRLWPSPILLLRKF